MKKISFSDKILNAAPGLKVLQINAACTNHPTSDDLWNEICQKCENISGIYKLEEINKRPAIAATRKAYKALGKEPNRYRPSSEAMCRRIINGKGLYRLSSLIDIINLISIASGYSIGGFDNDKIEGDSLLLDAGTHHDTFEGIGRGIINIAGLPVYRDLKGGIGTPTSDEERTKLTLHTSNLLMLVNIYGEEMEINETLEMARSLLIKFAAATSIEAHLHIAATGETVLLN
ncbi:MAG: hypothetical protein K2I44_06150 [Muribaculaceae bacterium]|nr:hypothetical protein [Muribaculaceae bacterium]